MPVEQAAIDQITAEVNRFGTDVKALNDNTKRELAELRAMIDANGKSVDPLVTNKLDTFAASVETKHLALEKGIKAVNDNVEKIDAVLKRPGAAGGGWSDSDTAKEAKAAFEWHKAQMANAGTLRVDSKIEANTEAYDEYKASFGSMLRARERTALPVPVQAALQTGSDPDGGYLVPQTISDRVIKFVFETSPIRAMATVETIAGKELVIPRDEGEFGYGWIGETVAPSENTTSQFGESKIVAHEMFAEPRATQSMLEDAGMDIEGWIGRKVGDKFARVEADAFLNGTGVNKPRGLLTYAAWTSAGVYESGKIEQIVSGAATSIKADGIYDLVYSLKAYYTANAKFMMKRTTVRDILKLKDGDGKYMWQMGDISKGQPATLIDYPVIRGEDMPTIGASALAVAFGDFAQTYTIVDRLGITLLRDNLTAKPYVKFYNRRRVGGDVVNFDSMKLLKISA